MVPGQRGLVRDTGLRVVVGKVNSGCFVRGSGDIPLGSGWIASSTGMMLWGPLSGVSLSRLAAEGSSTGKME